VPKRKTFAPVKEAREVPLALRITPSLKKAVEAAASAERRSISQIVLLRLEAAMKQEGYLK
jgi:uncharacterized protein (DUF1778 family)